MNTKSIVIFILVTLGVLVGSVALLMKFGNAEQTAITDIAGDSRISMGDGAITVVEFSDFQCPACKSVQEPLKQILTKNQGKVKFVYRYFPLTSIHKNAQISAQAAEAAFRQGKFWEMHDKLFTKQSEWEALADPTQVFGEYAQTIGLNKDQFLKDLQSKEVKDAVTNDSLIATKYRLTGTPSFYVNGVAVEFDQIEVKIAEFSK